jgi:DNA uptake protein ComE-like DNA-binding protein
MNLNTATSNMLVYLPRMNLDLVNAILDWRDTNGGSGASQTYYGMQQPPYVCKQAPFETVDELRLLQGADLDTLVGEDANRNGILDPNENDENHNSSLDPGVLEYVTVYSREPNAYSNGTPRVDIRTVTQGGPLEALLQGSLDSGRASAILDALFPPSPPNQRGGPARPPVILQFASPLAFFIRCHQPPASMTVDEFAQIANEISVTATTNSYIEGRVNINTASAAVLACLPGLSDNPDLAQTIINYRLSNPDKLTSIGWIVDALGQGNDTTLAALAAADCLTTQSYQFSADVAAVGAHGRGYRRVRFIFDTVDGTPKIVFRQDLTHLGWALGKGARESLLANNTR